MQRRHERIMPREMASRWYDSSDNTPMQWRLTSIVTEWNASFFVSPACRLRPAARMGFANDRLQITRTTHGLPAVDLLHLEFKILR